MRKSDRQTAIVLALQTGRRTASQLASRFEVSRRTILRDIDALSQAGVPIVALPGSGGGYEIASDYWMPPLQLTPDEASLLLLALEGFRSPDGSPFAATHRSISEKLRVIVPSTVIANAERANAAVQIPVMHRPERLSHLPYLRAALDGGEWVQIEYQSVNRTATHDILPLRLSLDGGRWYVEAVSLTPRAIRRFRIDRVLHVESLPEPEAALDVVEDALASEQIMSDVVEVVAKVSTRARRRLEDHPDLWNALGPDTDGESELRFSSPRSELAFFARELFALGPDVVVIAPQSFIDQVTGLANATLAKYEREW